MRFSLFSKNFLSLVGSTFLVQALRFLTIALLARRLGTNLFGVYNYIVLLITYGFTLVEFGLKNLAIREIAQGRGSSSLIKTIVKIRAALAFFAVVGVVALSYLAFNTNEYLIPSLYFGLSLLVDAFLIDFVVIAQERLVAQAISNVSQALFVYVASFLFVKDVSHFVLFSQLFLISHVIWVGAFYYFARPYLKHGGELRSNYLEIAKKGFPFLVAQFLFSMQASTDLLLLGQFHHSDLLGDYSAAMKILGIPMGIIFALMATVYPRVARYSHDFKSPELDDLMTSTTHLIWIFVVPMVMGSWLFGDHLILWFFGASYEGADAILKPLSLAMSLFFLGLPPMVAILVSHKMNLMMRVALINLSVSFISCFAVLFFGRPDLLPWAMVLAQGFFLIGTWWPFGKLRFIQMEQVKTLIIPTFLMWLPLSLPVGGPILKFTGAVIGYGCGLVISRIWKRPWVAIFQKTPS